jgi:hypothetical protein
MKLKNLGDATQNLAIPRPTSSSAASEKRSLAGTTTTTVAETIEMILESLSSDELQPAMSLAGRNEIFASKSTKSTVETFASETTNSSLQTATDIHQIYGIFLAPPSISLHLSHPRLSSSSKSRLSFEKESVTTTMI